MVFYTVNVWKIQINRRTLEQSAYHRWKILLSVYQIKYHKTAKRVVVAISYAFFLKKPPMLIYPEYGSYAT